MANYSKEELQYIASQVQPYLLELVKALGLDVNTIEVVEEYEGITSLPAYDDRGGTKKLVRVPLSAFAKPAADAIAEIEELIARSEETISKSEDSLVKTEAALNEIYIIRDELRSALDDAQKSISDLEIRIVDVEKSEAQRISNENTRVANENERENAEVSRENAEDVRVDNEAQRTAAFESWETNENKRVENESSRNSAEEVRVNNENMRKAAEEARKSAELSREQTKSDMVALNEELKSHPPYISIDNYWHLWDSVNKTYINTKVFARGQTPIIQNGTWWLWNDVADQYEDTGQSVSSDYVLKRENVENVLGGNPMFYVEEWNHVNAPYRSGSVVKFNQEFFCSLRDTDVPPVNLLLLGDGVIAKLDEHTYATVGSFDAEGNKDDWRKIPYDELRLISREGTLDGVETDVRNLSGSDVYRFQPHLEIDMVKGTIKGKKVDLAVTKKNVTDALGYTPTTPTEHQSVVNDIAEIKVVNQNQDKRLNELETNALVSAYTLEQSSNPAFEVSNKNAAKLYASQMGGYLFYNGNEDGKVYAAKLNSYDWGKLADGTPVTAEIEAATETMVHVPDCHFKAEGKTMNFGGIIPIDGGHTFGSPHWVGAYLGSIADGALHSRPNVAPSHSQTMESFWNYAQATHANKQYGLANYQFHCLINALFQARYGNLNSQEVIGMGWQHSNWEAARDVPMGVAKSLGDGSGKVYYNDSTLGSQYPVKLFGIEDLWGKFWVFRPNIRFEMRNGVRYAIVYDGNQVSNTATGREFVTSVQSANGEYVKSMKLGEYWDMIAESVGGSDIIYYCDGSWAATTGELLLVGGLIENGSQCGLSSTYSLGGFSAAYTTIGARLAYWGEPIIVSGAQLVAMINS